MSFTQDAGQLGVGEWYHDAQKTLAECMSLCESLATWGCQFISWRSVSNSKGYCYVHKDCTQLDGGISAYTAYKGACGRCESLTPSFKFIARIISNLALILALQLVSISTLKEPENAYLWWLMVLWAAGGCLGA